MGIRERVAKLEGKTTKATANKPNKNVKTASSKKEAKCGEPKKKMKKTSILDVTFCGYRCENDEGLMFYIEKPDEELTNKIMNNTLSAAERNWILGLGCDYYCKILPNDDHLVEFTISRPIIDHIETGEDSIITDDILNMDVLQSVAFQNSKNKETGEKELKFNKNKLRRADNNTIISCVVDPSLVYDNWMDAAYDKNSDIKNYITIDGLENELEHTLVQDNENEDVEASLHTNKKPCGTPTFTKTRRFRRRGLVRN